MNRKTSFVNVKILFAFIVLQLSVNGEAQTNSSAFTFNPLSFGVVLDNPAMKDVVVKKDITYLKDDKGSLNIDIYSPPQLKRNDKRPAIIFLNAIGERQDHEKVKSWGIYTSWPTLMAANGYIGISMETDGSRIQESIKGLFDFLEKSGSGYNVDAEKLGVYAASANVTQSFSYLMSDKVCRGIKAAVLYYGGAVAGPFRKDLPVLFVISEGDISRNGYGNLWNEVLKNNAPWTIRMGTGMPHAFDAYADNDDARKIIKETISFWKNELDPVPAPSFAHSTLRDVFGLLQMNKPKALQLLKSIADEHPDNVRVLLFYANVLSESGKQDEAEALYKKVLLIEPKNTEAMIAMAGMLYIKDKPAEAEKYISDAVNSGSITPGHYGNLAFVLLVAGKDKEAAKYYEKAVALQPNGHDFYNLACAYAKYGEKERAFTALDKSLEYGYGSKNLYENDEDLISLRSDDRFKALLLKIK